MNSSRLAAAFFAAGLAGSLAACAEEKPHLQRDSPEVQEMREQALKRKALERTPEEQAPVTGEVPEGIMNVLKADLASHAGITNPNIVIAQAVEWPSGALGCPQPGMVYTQVVVPGYRVLFEYQGERWDYRVSDTGGFILCDQRAQLRRQEAPPAL